MKPLLRFFSLTTATQLFLLINQLLLLPLQLRVWGQADVATWFITIATANLVSVADLGLRNAGHDALLASRKGDAAARAAFRPIWAMTRGLVVGLSGLFIAYRWIADSSSFALVALITVSVMLDTLTILRGIWCDTLGYFNRVEASYCGLVATRVALSAGALWLFNASPLVLAAIFLVTSMGALLVQVALLHVPELALSAGGFADLRLQSFHVVRWVVAEPIAGWMRMSLPVIVLAALAPSPAFITTYVAVRAIFGVPRQVIIQLSRYVSVQYADRHSEGVAATDRLVRHAVLAATLVGMAIASGLLADHGRLLRLWLHPGNVAFEDPILLSFSVIALTLGHQMIVGIMIRCGVVVAVAKRLYIYLTMGLVAAGMAHFVFGTVSAYLALLTLQELVIAGLFVATLGYEARRIIIAAFTAALGILGVLWGIVALDPGKLFQAAAPSSWVSSMLLAGTAVAITVGLFYAIDRFARVPHAISSASWRRWA